MQLLFLINTFNMIFDIFRNFKNIYSLGLQCNCIALLQCISVQSKSIKNTNRFHSKKQCLENLPKMLKYSKTTCKKPRLKHRDCLCKAHMKYFTTSTPVNIYVLFPKWFPHRTFLIQYETPHLCYSTSSWDPSATFSLTTHSKHLETYSNAPHFMIAFRHSWRFNLFRITARDGFIGGACPWNETLSRTEFTTLEFTWS